MLIISIAAADVAADGVYGKVDIVLFPGGFEQTHTRKGA